MPLCQEAVDACQRLPNFLQWCVQRSKDTCSVTWLSKKKNATNETLCPFLPLIVSVFFPRLHVGYTALPSLLPLDSSQGRQQYPQPQSLLPTALLSGLSRIIRLMSQQYRISHYLPALSLLCICSLGSPFKGISAFSKIYLVYSKSRAMWELE